MNAIQRFRRSALVGRTATRIFLAYRWHSWKHRKSDPEISDQALSEVHRRNAESILAAATKLRGMIIKLGQILGARADVVPDEYIEVLSKLHDEVPAHPFHVVRRHVEQELGAKLEDVFAEFSREPIAAASLAQVHRGRLHDGRDVAVKVQYPEIEEIVKVDLQNIRALGRVGGLLMRDYDIQSMVDELSANAPLELDFIHEGQNAEACAANFDGQEDIVVPKIYWEHSTKRVLVMEFLEGIKITDLDAIDAAGIDRQQIAKLLSESYFKQIFSHGFFHADPHPGNLFVQPGPKLVIVDFGLAKELPPGFLAGFVKLIAILVSGSTDGIAQAFRDLGFKTRHDDDTVFETIGDSMVHRLSRNREFNESRELMGEFQANMMKVFRENPVVSVPGEFLYLGRVMGLLAGLGVQLGSQVNLLEVMGSQLPSSNPASA
jgi:predicted unusual protein kinase regulating ubiquinone biosynthesis (AarF/ABC1/UbiB family)